MKHVVFISHSSVDRAVAEEICGFLEKNEILCWIAPRDVTPGMNYGAAILDAIAECPVFLLVLTGESNKSGQVVREVERAATSNSIIIPFRVQDVQPSRDLEFYVSSTHWLDASTKPFEKHLHELLTAIRTWQQNVGAKDQPGPASSSPLPLDVTRPARPFAKLAVAVVAAIGFCTLLGYIALRQRNAAPAASSATEESAAPVALPNPETPATRETPGAIASPPGSAAAVTTVTPGAPVVIQDVAATSELHFNGGGRKASHAFDGLPASAWVPEGDGIGQSLSVRFKAPATIHTVSILAAQAMDKEFRIRNRVRTLRVTFGDGNQETLTLEDKDGVQHFDLAHSVTTDSVKFEILSVYRGLKLRHTPIFEIMFNRQPNL